MKATPLKRSALLGKSALKAVLVSVAVFIVTGVSAFYLEEPFRRLTRSLYKFFTSDRISFVGKGFHFASASFLVSFGLYSVLFYHFLMRLEKSRRMLFAMVTLLTFAMALVVVTAFDSNAQIVTCTACKNNQLALGYNDLSYDTIFIVCLTVSLIPIATALYKKQKAKRLRASL